MRYYTIEPPLSLKRYVKFFWVLESDEPGYTHRSMAQACAEMVFHYKGQFREHKGDRSELSFLSGIQAPSTHVRRFSIKQSFGIFGVYLYPYTVPLLVNASAEELTDHMLDLHTLMGREGAQLEEQMMEAPNNSSRAYIISAFLERKLLVRDFKETRLFPAVEDILQQNGTMPLLHLADRYCLSQRQFERKFKELTGFAPKLFSRIARFSMALEQYGTNKSLTQIAHEAGYYDQSHFIRDFTLFSGLAPKAYFKGYSEGTAWRQ